MIRITIPFRLGSVSHCVQRFINKTSSDKLHLTDWMCVCVFWRNTDATYQTTNYTTALCSSWKPFINVLITCLCCTVHVFTVYTQWICTNRVNNRRVICGINVQMSCFLSPQMEAWAMSIRVLPPCQSSGACRRETRWWSRRTLIRGPRPALHPSSTTCSSQTALPTSCWTSQKVK